MLKSLVKYVFRQFNYELVRKKKTGSLIQPSNPEGLNSGATMIDSLLRLKKAGINPGLIIDLGAAKGKWTEKSLKVWPEADYVLIEPLAEQLEQISGWLRKSGNVTLIEAVAGNKSGTVSFNVSPDLDGSGVYGGEENARSVSVIKLDDITLNVSKSILLKLDTHGYEIPIFEGAEKTFEKTEAIIVEVYGFFVSPTAVLFHDISIFLNQKGFQLYDIVDIMRRDSDNAFWQADAVYLKKTSKIFASNNFK